MHWYALSTCTGSACSRICKFRTLDFQQSVSQGVRIWRWMIRSYLGRERDGIRCELHSTIAPSPARPALIATIDLAAGWKILPRKRHERQQGGLARASKPNACSLRAVMPACLLAVSNGRTLRAGRLASHGWEARAWGSASPGPSLASNRLFSGPPPRSVELIIYRGVNDVFIPEGTGHNG